jgi:hypothetical protein
MNNKCLQYGNLEACTFNPNNNCKWFTYKNGERKIIGRCVVDHETVWNEKVEAEKKKKK